mgnify:CR=1 FL=1
MVIGELKTKSSKNLFKKLNEYSKDLQAKQEKIIKKYNSLASQYEELEHLKVNMNDYLDHNKTEKKKRNRLLVQLGSIRVKKGKILKKRIKYRKKLKDNFVVGVVLGLHRLLMFLLWQNIKNNRI